MNEDSIMDMLDQMIGMAQSTNAAKVTIGWEAPLEGYLEITYYAKKPRRK